MSGLSEILQVYFRYRLTTHMCFVTSFALSISHCLCKENGSEYESDNYLFAFFAPYTYIGWNFGKSFYHFACVKYK